MSEQALNPLRGDVWMAVLDPVIGREQAGTRPVLIISVDRFNGSPAELAVCLPITSKNKAIPYHVGVSPPEGGCLWRVGLSAKTFAAFLNKD